MAERDGVDGSSEELDRMLAGEDLPADGAHDPLVIIAAALHEALPRETPSAEFRARLKAELLERHANNVREFPAHTRPMVLPELPPERAPQRRRFGIAAMATAAAAAAAVALGIGATHLKDQPRSPTVAQVYHKPSATPTPTPTQHALPERPTATIVTVAPTRVTVASTRVAVAPTRAAVAPTPVARGGNPDSVVPPVPSPSATAPARPQSPEPTMVAQLAPATATPTIGQSFPAPASPTPVNTSTPPPTATSMSVATPNVAPTLVPTATAIATPHLIESQQNTPGPTMVAQVFTTSPTATIVPAAPTASSTQPATAVPTATPTPGAVIDTVAATSTPVPPVHTDTPVPPKPTDTQVPVPVATSTAGTQLQPAATSTAGTQLQPTATVRQPAPSSTPTPTQPAPSATATSTVPAATSTPSPTTTAPAAADTPVQPSDATATVAPPATFAMQPTMVAQVAGTGTPGKHAVAANQAGATSTPVPGPSFPLPSVAAAPPDSPLSGLQPLASGIKLHAAGLLPSDPGLLPVIAPIAHDVAARQILQSYGFLPTAVQSSSESTGAFSATVSLNHLQYSAVLTAESYGYSLMLQLSTIAPPATAASGSAFDAASDARTFLHVHGLDENLQSTAVLPGQGTTTVTFTTYLSNTFSVPNAGASLTYNSAGVLTSADIHVVDDSTAPTVSGISAEDALAEIASGGGIVQAAPNVVVDSSSTVTDATILYLPIASAGGTYLEPMYRFDGVTAANQPFQVFAPAIDHAYLR